jgi:alkanesulfonate monooxygenase SsuD/methylene tetrahydromethanopterin reductase-like flavin-dependent oxidoreductase (luciferase family)
MEIGIGMPNSVREANGRNLIEFARRADQAGFSTLATIDRVAFPSYESLIALAAAAAVTERIRLMPNVLLGPTRNPVMLAKESASVDRLSNGRLVLGVGVAGRKDDLDAVGLGWSDRGKRWDGDLDLIHRVWAGELVNDIQNPVGPSPTNENKVPMIFGGGGDAAIRRTIQYGIGWTAGGQPADAVRPFAEQVRAAWKEAARPGDPRIVALSYYSIGEEDAAKGYILDYYAFFGDFAKQMADWIPKDAQGVKDTVKAFEDAGVDELILDATVDDPDQVDKLAEAVL